eukprot:7387249-Prymnesium_polylepis.1
MSDLNLDYCDVCLVEASAEREIVCCDGCEHAWHPQCLRGHAVPHFLATMVVRGTATHSAPCVWRFVSAPCATTWKTRARRASSRICLIRVTHSFYGRQIARQPPILATKRAAQ